MGRKHREIIKEQKRKEKAKSFKGIRKTKYQNIELGAKELRKYAEMYREMPALCGENSLPCIDRGETPTRRNYDEIRRLYRETFYEDANPFQSSTQPHLYQHKPHNFSHPQP